MNKIQHRDKQPLRESGPVCLTERDGNYLIAERVILSPRVLEFLQKLQGSTVEILPIIEALQDAVEVIFIRLNQAEDQELTDDLFEWLYDKIIDEDSSPDRE